MVVVVGEVGEWNQSAGVLNTVSASARSLLALYVRLASRSKKRVISVEF